VPGNTGPNGPVGWLARREGFARRKNAPGGESNPTNRPPLPSRAQASRAPPLGHEKGTSFFHDGGFGLLERPFREDFARFGLTRVQFAPRGKGLGGRRDTLASIRYALTCRALGASRGSPVAGFKNLPGCCEPPDALSVAQVVKKCRGDARRRREGALSAEAPDTERQPGTGLFRTMEPVSFKK